MADDVVLGARAIGNLFAPGRKDYGAFRKLVGHRRAIPAFNACFSTIDDRPAFDIRRYAEFARRFGLDADPARFDAEAARHLQERMDILSTENRSLRGEEEVVRASGLLPEEIPCFLRGFDDFPVWIDEEGIMRATLVDLLLFLHERHLNWPYSR